MAAIKQSYLPIALSLFLYLFHSGVETRPASAADVSAPSQSGFTGLLLPPFAAGELDQTDDTAVRNVFLVNLGPRLLELKTSYIEKGEESGESSGFDHERKLRSHFDLLATSSYFDGELVAEGELAYSSLDPSGAQGVGDELPLMLRLGLRHRWGELNYGADYKSFDRGFVSTTGAEFDAEREEGELWVERRLGAIFHIRGAVGETWEKPECADQAMLTRSASAALNFHQPNWGGSFISNYSLMEQGAGFVQETEAFTHAFLGSYRPSGILSLSPNVSIKEERDPRTRVRIESPAAGLTVQYAPLLNLLMTGAASYSRSFGRNGAVDLRSLGAATAIDWKLGKSRGRDRSLSLNLKYNQQMDAVSSRNAHDISTLLQWKVSGF